MADAQTGYWCIVAAAGRGRRFSSEHLKQYAVVAGKPLLMHTLERLAAHPLVLGIVLVLAVDDESWPASAQLLLGKPVLRATGGAERAGSVRAGLTALPDDVAEDNHVLIHDAARPCIRADDISRLIELAGPAGGGLLAVPLRDTLKRGDSGHRVECTESREMRWRAATPQLFRRGQLSCALDQASKTGAMITDESMAMELAGHRPLLVEGAEDNIKVTTPADLALVEFLLQRAARAESFE